MKKGEEHDRNARSEKKNNRQSARHMTQRRRKRGGGGKKKGLLRSLSQGPKGNGPGGKNELPMTEAKKRSKGLSREKKGKEEIDLLWPKGKGGATYGTRKGIGGQGSGLRKKEKREEQTPRLRWKKKKFVSLAVWQQGGGDMRGEGSVINFVVVGEGRESASFWKKKNLVQKTHKKTNNGISYTKDRKNLGPAYSRRKKADLGEHLGGTGKLRSPIL